MSRKVSKEDLKRHIMEFANKHGSFCINTISQQYKIKWETVNTTVQKLVSEGRLFLIADTQNPRMYSIWPSTDLKRTKKTVLATIEDREKTGEESQYYARYTIPYLRASDHDDIRKSIGFVCHPTVKGNEVDIDFVRAHWRGSFTVEVKKHGSMHPSWKLDGEQTVGSWKVTPMSGNLSCSGRIKLGDDPEAYSINALTRKDGTIGSLRVYVHSRFIFYKASDRTAIAEFHQQVEDITGVLAKFGWEFGQIADNGKIENLHRAMNSIKLGMIAMQAKGYEDKETDMVHFDHSHGTPEAEVYGASEEANATVEFLAHPLERISAIETHLDLIDTTMGKMSSTMGKMSSTMIKVLEVLAQQSEILVKLSETQSNGAYAPTKADDGIAYGRADL